MKKNIEYLKQTLIIYERDINLIKSLFSEDISENDFLFFLKKLDFNKERKDYIYLLAYFGEKFKYKNVDTYTAKKLKRITRLRQYHNISLFYYFKKLAVELNNKNIPILFLKGAAIKFSTPQANFRNMDDIDFAVPPELAANAVETALEIGFKISTICEHSTDLKYDDFNVDIHHRIFRSNYSHVHNENKVFERAKKHNAWGLEFLIPSAVDLALILVSNTYYNIIDLPCNPRIIQWIYDFAYIIKNNPDFDWDLFIETAYSVELSRQAVIMLNIFNDYFPELLPENIFQKIKFQKNDEECLKTDIMYIKSNMLRLKLLHNKEYYSKIASSEINIKFPIFDIIRNRLEYVFLLFTKTKPVQFFISDLITEKWIKNAIEKYRLQA